MTDPTQLEPKNGDFVAYLDRLQEDSLNALREANKERLTHPVAMPDSAEGESALKKIAAELRERIAADRAGNPPAEPMPAPVAPPPTTAAPQERESVLESFRRSRSSPPASRPEPTAAPQPIPPGARRRKNSSFLLFVGNCMIMFGVFLSIVFTNEGMDEFVAPAIMFAVIGLFIMKVAKARR